MGKPFLSELRQLEATYSAALSIDISALRAAIIESLRYSLIAIGSGGSLSASHYACYLHQLASGKIAKTATPFDIVSMLEESGSRRSVIESAAICFSAGGSNADINRAWRSLIDAEPRHLTAICARTNSPIANVARRHTYTNIFDFDLPSRKDGFLATNSLFAFLIIMMRVYGPLIDAAATLPQRIWDLLPEGFDVDDAINNLRHKGRNILERDYLIVLYGGGMKAAACDFESKFSEAALGAVQMADYRNFAHGRHHWLAKFGKQSGVIAFANDRDLEIAKRTVELLPSDIPSAVFHYPGSPMLGGVGAVLTGFFLTAIAGDIRGIDPGKPGVPTFGRKLYHLGLGIRKKASSYDKSSIRRKSDACHISQQKLLKDHRFFCRSLTATSFSGLILDYDGTLCQNDRRFEALDSIIVQELVRLLQASIPIGIATGRGKSVKASLQAALPKHLWKQVIVGYYNGAECALLGDDSAPDGSDKPCKELYAIARRLSADDSITSIAAITIRKFQVSIEPFSTSYIEILWGIVGAHLSCNTDSKMVLSAHSIDILAPGVTKRSVIDSLITSGAKATSETSWNILCIGDQGRWPGNDYDLLAERFSLSVDAVSSDSTTCWNLAPSGYRGQQATLFYLKNLVASNGAFKISLIDNGENSK